MIAPLTFKVATESWEREQIHRLNYRTFVDEIPQHARNAQGILIDKFDHENTYFICLEGRRLLGMVALRDVRPFSLDAKLENLDVHLPESRSPCEIRLLAVTPGARQGVVLFGILERLVRRCVDAGYDIALISATVRQLTLYRRLGFEPFGTLVGTAEAPFQPMCLTRERLVGHTLPLLTRLRRGPE